MRLFAKFILIYLGVMLVFIISLELALLTQENEYSYKRHFIENHLDDIKVLMLGSSLFQTSIDPVAIGDSVFNSSLGGIKDIHKNSASYQMAFRYVPKMKNLKALIVPYPIFDIYNGSDSWIYDTESNNRTNNCMKVKYLDTPEDIRDYMYWSEFINSKKAYIKRFILSDKESRCCDSMGFVNTGHKLGNRQEGWKFNYGDNPAEKPREQTWSVIEGYNDVAELCRQNGVTLIGIATPLYKTRAKGLTPKFKADYKYTISEIHKKYPEVKFFDYTYDSRFSSDDFFDAVHLNNNGAIKFSRIVKEEVLGWK